MKMLDLKLYEYFGYKICINCANSKVFMKAFCSQHWKFEWFSIITLIINIYSWNDGYFFSQPNRNCFKCNESCFKCTGPNKYDCLSCSNGYFIAQLITSDDVEMHMCVRCEKGCSECSSYLECITCKECYRLVGNNDCEQCEEGCNKCDSNSKKCT